MKTFLKVVLYAVIGVAVFVGACYVRGMYLPAQATVDASTTIMAPPARVWSTLTKSAALPQWRKSVTAVEPLPEENGDPCIYEKQTSHRTKVCEHVTRPGRQVVFRIDDDAFRGTWTVDLAPIQNSATHVTITQEGTFANPWYRFLAYQFGIESEMKKAEAELKAYVEQANGAQ